MSIKFNGTNISQPKYNGVNLTKVSFNGTKVWPDDEPTPSTSLYYGREMDKYGSYIYHLSSIKLNDNYIDCSSNLNGGQLPRIASSGFTNDYIKMDNEVVPLSTNNGFRGALCYQIDLTGLNTALVANMSNMFYQCSATTINGLNTLDVSNVINISNIFARCKSLTSLDVSNGNTSNVVNMDLALSELTKLTSLDVSNWDTSNVENMRAVFTENQKIVTLDLTNWDTRKVTNMGGLFKRSGNLEHIYVGDNGDTSKVTESYLGTELFSMDTKLPNYVLGQDGIEKAYVGPGGYLESL